VYIVWGVVEQFIINIRVMVKVKLNFKQQMAVNYIIIASRVKRKWKSA
jgi:hypothetical protein